MLRQALNYLSRTFRRTSDSYAARQQRQRLRLDIETLEMRWLPANFGMNSATYTVDETTRFLEVQIDKTGFGTGTVDYATSSGTATSGTDFTSTSGTLSFGFFDLSMMVRIPITDDDFSDNGETFTFTLSNSSGGLNSPSSATITVNDGTSSWNISGQQRVIDAFQGARYPFGDATIGMQTGDYSIRQGFDYGQGGAVFDQPSLVYHSDTTSPRPIVEATVTIPSGEPTPSSSEARFTWNGGSPGSWTSFGTRVAGDSRWVYGFQVSTAVTTTGAYPWSIEVKEHFSTLGDVYRTYSGTALVVANNGAYGQGWSIDGFNQLVAVSGGMMMVYGGGGSARLFTGSGGTYTSPANDYGTLVKNGNNTYTYTAKDQTVYQFDTGGNLTAITDPHSLTRTFTYSSGLLSTVSEPDGGVTTFTYSSGKLATIVQPGSRTVTITINGSSDLTTIADADGSLRTFTYDANHDLTNERWGTQNVTMTYSGTTELLTNVDRGSSNTLAFTAGVAVPLSTSPGKRWGDVNSAMTDSGLTTLTVTLDQAGRLINYNGDLPSGGGGSGVALPAGGGISSSITRDSAGNITVYTDALSRTTTYSYNGSGDLTQIQHPDSSLETFTYDSTFHKVLTHKNTLSHTSTYTYNGTGDLTSIKDALGNLTTFSYSSGLLQTIQDAQNHLTTLSYDGNRRLESVKNALSNITTYTYDSAGNVQSVKNANSHLTTYSYDAKHRPLTVKDALNGVMTYTYNQQGQVTSVTNPLSQTTSLAYNAQGWNTSITEAVGTGLARTTSYVYLNNGWVSSVTDALSQTTNYSYTIYGDVAVVVDPLGHRVTYTYDNGQQVINVTDGLSNISTYTYNSRGWMTSAQNALGNITTLTYDTEGNRLTEKNANNGVTTYTYDVLNRVTEVKDALSHIATTVYDSLGNVQAVVDAIGNRTTYSYDAINELQTARDALGNVTTYSYDAVGNVTSIKDALNNVMTYVYDELNRRVNTIEANGSKTTFIYDANNQMTGLVDPNSNRTTFIYDALGRQTQELDALNKTITYTYDVVDQLTQKKDRKSQTIDYGYDAAGRLTGEIWKNSGGTTTNTQTFTYDNANRLLTARDANGAYTFTYDAVGQVTTQKDMWGNTLTFTYDAVGNRTKVQDNFSGVETSVYDAANNLTSRRFGGIGGSSLRLDLSYNAANLLENIKRYNAASGGSLIGQTTYVYDAVFNLTGLKNADGSATVLSQYTYTYDAGNRLTTEVLGGSTTTYTYDVRSQLTGDTTASYGYDSAGNRNNNSQTIGTGNRLSADVNWTYNYDDEGNLTSKVSVGSPTATWTYTWDVNNRLTAIDKSAGGNSLYNISYKYDVFGNRIEQGEDTDGAGSGASNVTTRFAWEGAKVSQNAWGQRQMAVGMENWNIWADLDGSNNLKVRYVRGDEVDQLFARVKADGTVASYLTDRMGSVRQMVDASGVLKDTISYDGFGNVIAETDAAFGDRWKWTGRESNAYTGLQYNRARYYNGEIGRWVSEDPIRYTALDNNLTRYASNSAVINCDPSGYQDSPWAEAQLRKIENQAKEAGRSNRGNTPINPTPDTGTITPGSDIDPVITGRTYIWDDGEGTRIVGYDGIPLITIMPPFIPIPIIPIIIFPNLTKTEQKSVNWLLFLKPWGDAPSAGLTTTELGKKIIVIIPEVITKPTPGSIDPPSRAWGMINGGNK